MVLGAGTDPTHIPGLDTAEPDEPESLTDERPPSGAAQQSPGATDPADAVESEEADAEEAPPEGPAFEVSDRRGSIVADGAGVVFTLDDTEARWPWSEIGSVEVGASRFGRRFEVAVGTTDHRRFDAEVQATSKQELEKWTADLEEVLDAWFEGA